LNFEAVQNADTRATGNQIGWQPVFNAILTAYVDACKAQEIGGKKCAASKFPVSHPFKLTPAQPKLTQPPIHSTSIQPRIHFTPIERRTLSLLCKPASSRMFDFQFRTSHIRSIHSKFIHLSVPFLYVYSQFKKSMTASLR
jgi:hypothetical protein